MPTIRQLEHGKLTKRQKAALQASVAQRASADEVAALAAPPPLARWDAPSPAQPNLLSPRFCDRIQRSEWKEHIERATAPRRSSRRS
ncbi:MAG: hypothetical protein JOZ69_09020 [Myxococcales bacterium]|nr:hypothetical protein [Myxococcales bacterium]